MKSSSAWPACCISSNTSTTSPCSASRSKNARQAENSAPRGIASRPSSSSSRRMRPRGGRAARSSLFLEQAGQHRREPFVPELDRVLECDPGSLPEHLGQRAHAGAGTVGDRVAAMPKNTGRRLMPVGVLLELPCESRLTDLSPPHRGPRAAGRPIRGRRHRRASASSPRAPPAARPRGPRRLRAGRGRRPERARAQLATRATGCALALDRMLAPGLELDRAVAGQPSDVVDEHRVPASATEWIRTPCSTVSPMTMPSCSASAVD